MADPKAHPKFWNEATREVALADFVSISSPVTEHDSITRLGDYLRVWRIDGVPFEAADTNRISSYHESLCNLIRNLEGGATAIWAHRIQRKVTDEMQHPQSPAFGNRFSHAYYGSITSKPFLSKELYLTVVHRPYPSSMARNYGRAARDIEFVRRKQEVALAVMRETSTLVERTLREFQPTLLGVREDEGVLYWESGELFSYLVNGSWTKVKFPTGPVWKTLPEARVSVGGNKLELRTQNRTRYAAMLDIKEYASVVEPGTLSALLYEECEFIETQSFAILPRRQATAALITQRNQLISSDDVVVTQIAAMDTALDGLGDGQFHMGEYSYSLAVLGDTVEQAGQLASKASGAIAETSAMQVLPIELLADAAWFAQLPGNFQWRPRKASISSRAFAALSCFHIFFRGKRDGNPWGEALMMFRTPGGDAFYFNLHASPPDQDSEGKRLPGSTLLLGSTGSGKTTLLSALLSIASKYTRQPRIVSFSLDRDTEIVIRAMGGRFVSFDRNVPTGINPMQRDPTEDRIGHWVELVKQCIASPELPLLPSDEEAINLAVRSVAAMDRSVRCFSTVQQNLPRGNSGNSLFNRFAKWCGAGEYGWVFDRADDTLLDIGRHQYIGFDYTGVASSPDVRKPIMMELLHVMEGLTNGEPLIYHVAEAWKALGDPVFAPFLKHQQKTIRKKNGLGIFDTQEVGDLLSNDNGRTMVEQSVTKILLPNADASRADYVDGLGLTDSEFDIVRRLGAQGSRRFLCKQGVDSVECEFDLTGMDDMLTVLSTTLENVELLDAIRSEVGDDPDVFLPILYQRARMAMRSRIRRVA